MLSRVGLRRGANSANTAGNAKSAGCARRAGSAKSAGDADTVGNADTVGEAESSDERGGRKVGRLARARRGRIHSLATDRGPRNRAASAGHFRNWAVAPWSIPNSAVDAPRAAISVPSRARGRRARSPHSSRPTLSESTRTSGAGQKPGALPPARCGLPAPLTTEEIDAVVRPALDEDRLGPERKGAGDITSDNVVPAGARARARLVCKASGRLAGIDVFARVVQLCDPTARAEVAARDGDEVRPGQVLAQFEGSARALLGAERTALNLIQRMSGVATVTARYVERCAGRARVLDTRKTTPNLRVFEKYSVRCGGGENHRFGLFDEAMVKNNHLDMAGRGLVGVLADLRQAVGQGVRLTAEARDEQEALDAASGGADVVLLDNMTPERMAALTPRLREASARAGRRLEVEASGGITLETIGAVAQCGVDRISIGALTHSAPAMDLSFYLEPLA